MLKVSQYSFSKITQFSYGSNVKDTLVYNTICTASHDTCVSAFCYKSIFFLKLMFNQLENAFGLQVLLSQANSNLPWNKVLYISASSPDGIVPRDPRVSSIQLTSGILHKVSGLPSGKPWELGSTPFKNLLNSHFESLHKTLLLLEQMVLFQEVHVFLLFSWVQLLCSRWMVPPHKNVER
jgi:hypothetical protein